VPENELFRERLKKPHGFIRLRFEDDSAVDAAPAGQERAKYGKDKQKIEAEKNIPAISEIFAGDAAPAFPIQGRVAPHRAGFPQDLRVPNAPRHWYPPRPNPVLSMTGCSVFSKYSGEPPPAGTRTTCYRRGLSWATDTRTKVLTSHFGLGIVCGAHR